MSGKNDENKSFWPNQSAPSIYIMIELCYFSLGQWEIRIHLLWGKCFHIPHHCDPHLNQTKFNDLLPLTIHGVLESVNCGSNSILKVRFFGTSCTFILSLYQQRHKAKYIEHKYTTRMCLIVKFCLRSTRKNTKIFI